MADKLVLEVSKDGWTKGLQLNIAQLDENDRGHGYRLAGPKFNGSSKTLLKTELEQRDADEIRSYLDAVFPVETDPSLEAASKKLSALEAAGVDNWEGYGNAMSILHGDEDDD